MPLKIKNVKGAPPKTLAKRVQFLMERIQDIIGVFVASVDEERYTASCLVLFGALTKPGAFPPDDYLSEFEISFLDLNSYGRLG